MFNTIFDSTATGLDVTTALICSGVALGLGIVIAITHMVTSQTSKSFLVTLATLPLLVMAVMIMINGNLGTSIAILGAFSLIRFRSIQGRAKDLLSIFFAMAIGLATGTGYVAFAALFTLIVALLILILNALHFGESSLREKRLVVLVPEDLDYPEIFDEILLRFAKKYNLAKVKTTNMGSLFELTYMLELKNNIKEKDLIDKIRAKNGNLKVALSHAINEEEL